MKNFYVLFILLATLLLNGNFVSAQDRPDGFASISGNGLETTTGGEGGKVIIVETVNKLSIYAGSSNPYILIIKGVLASENFKTIVVSSNTSIIGYGTNATLKNIELQMIDKENIIIRNLIIRDSYVEGDWDGKENDNDAIQADNCHHLWIDHCYLTHCGDGLIDLRKACDNITISYTKLSNHNKAFGIGWTDRSDFHTTIHHCWFDSTNQRNPSFDMGIGHLYNNYLSNISSYGNLSRGTGKIIVENSCFYKVNDPIKISDTAILYDKNNHIEACTGSQSGNASRAPYDISSYYEYDLDPTDQIIEIVEANVGPQQAVSDQYESIINSKVDIKEKTIDYYVDQQAKTLNIVSSEALKIQFTLYSLYGKILKANKIDAFNAQVSLNALKAGAYIVQFELPNHIESGKIYIK